MTSDQISRRIRELEEIALTWENIEQRRAAAEIVGWHRVLEQLDARTIDEDVDPQVGRLVEVDLPDADRERFVVVQCGTGRTFALPVPPTMQTALGDDISTYECNGWTLVMPSEGCREPKIKVNVRSSK